MLGSRMPERGLAGFAALDAEPDAAAYIAFLDGFQQRFAEMIEIGIAALRMPRGGAVLDIGCGHGAAFVRLDAQVGPSGRIAGIDASRALVAEACRRHGADPRFELRVGDAHALPYADHSFDAVRVDRVLIFLRDPRAALAEAVRVLRPAGRIVVTEGDFGSVVVDAEDAATTRRVLAAVCEAIPQPEIGRRLRGLFVELGLREVETQVFPIESTDFDEWRLRMGITPLVERLHHEPGIGARAGQAWLDNLRARDSSRRFYAANCLFMASATK